MSMRETLIIIPLADGAEEMEAVTIRDVLQRAGLDARFVGLDETPVLCARGARLLPDQAWDDVLPDDLLAVVLPGGMGGTRTWMEFAPLQPVLRDTLASGRVVGAICAAPLVLGVAGVLAGRRYTCYPGCQDEIADGEYVNARVVQDGNLLTSQGPGTAVEFSLALVRMLAGDAMAEQVAKGLIWNS